MSGLVHPLRVAREAKGFSMRQLAQLAGLGKYGHRNVLDWEHGKRVPTLLVANALAPHLGYPSGEVLRQACQEWKMQRVEQ